MDFTGKLGKYKVIETEDQTKTLWSEYFDEACHNLSGAYQETLYNYIVGCEIKSQIESSDKLHVLDVGFGLGMGLLALIDELSKYSLVSKTLTYTSIELDEDLFLWSIKENFPNLKFEKNENHYLALYKFDEDTRLSITIYIGDGRKTLLEALEKKQLPVFSAIFQDAFSPKKNPHSGVWNGF